MTARYIGCMRCGDAVSAVAKGLCDACDRELRRRDQERHDRLAARKVPREDETPTPEDCGVRGTL